MSDVDALLQEYIEEHRSGGEADPLAYLDRTSGADRRELAALIDGYLARAPRREWNREAYERSDAPELVEALSTSLRGVSGAWPSLLPRLRNRARMARADLVAELASRLGAQNQREKVGRYYHQMEAGQLDPAGVSDTVLSALGQIVDESVETLRRAGEAFGAEQPPGPDAPAFARSAAPAGGPIVTDQAQQRVDLEGSSADWDQVDRLFLAG